MPSSGRLRLNTSPCSLAPTRASQVLIAHQTRTNGPSGEQQVSSPPGGQCLLPAPTPSGAPLIVSTFLKCLMTLFCPFAEWETALLVPFLALRNFGRGRGTAFHTPPHDADDPSPPRTVSHDLFLCSYVINEANLGSTGSTTIQTIFLHVRAGDGSHLAIFTTPHVTQVDIQLIMVRARALK